MTKSWCWLGIINRSQAHVHGNICMQHYLHTFSQFNCNLSSKNKHPASQTHVIWMFAFIFVCCLLILRLCLLVCCLPPHGCFLHHHQFKHQAAFQVDWEITPTTILHRKSWVCKDCISNIYSKSHIFQFFRSTKPSCPQTDVKNKTKFSDGSVSSWCKAAPKLHVCQENFLLASKLYSLLIFHYISQPDDNFSLIKSLKYGVINFTFQLDNCSAIATLRV